MFSRRPRAIVKPKANRRDAIRGQTPTGRREESEPPDSGKTRQHSRFDHQKNMMTADLSRETDSESLDSLGRSEGEAKCFCRVQPQIPREITTV